MSDPEKLIIANCSGFFGDRLSAAREMVQGGPIDVLTGDYLAELTMAILFQKKLKSPEGGYVPTFLKQMEAVMGQCLEKGIRVVANAGGLNPAGLARTLKTTVQTLGLSPRIAYIEGDDLMPRLKTLQQAGEPFTHLDKGVSLADAGAVPITANAYLGAWGIAAALAQGADIVICGRVADAALVAGPCAWRFGWQRTDWDRLAGAYAAGHIIECGAQATGGNYSFVHEVPSYRNVGFPIAEMHPDGSFVITKHPDTGGLVSVGTVTAQLLYEIAAPTYLTPDVAVRIDTLSLTQEGPDRVRGAGTRGEPPPETTKVCINTLGGYKNTMTVVLTGLDIDRKAEIVADTLFDSLGGRERFRTVDVQLVHAEKIDPATNDEAFAFLRITVMDPDADKVGKRFSAKVVEMALANIPGFTLTSPPTNGAPAVVHWPALVSNRHIHQTICIDDRPAVVVEAAGADEPFVVSAPIPDIPAVPGGPTVRAPLGRAFATRSGDKGGNANLGIWAQTPEAYAFLRRFLTIERLKRLLPDCASLPIERYELPNLLAVNFYIRGLLGDGVAASVRSDPQAKTLGEYLRAKIVEMPVSILVTH
ncbi:acyclic terpene utilization AtuA family protein [Desulfatitalea tepidiphila]|uniref:acyclic terpene utilization AtuA family protein n=1 Tax=Desulfatitalea tepidiphila TaxID=1185843 RepID=UPI0006B4D6DC|nr:acyclic terpene utilization AtuA family protein [Desulfatitalea tepidiphila]